MQKSDRREKLALDEAYGLFQNSLEHDTSLDLYKLAKALKTVSTAIEGAAAGHFKLTLKLWHRIHASLFDKLLTSYPCHIVIRDQDGTVVCARGALPADGTIDIHPEGLKRDDDCFSLPVKQLDADTRDQMEKAWLDHGPSLRKEDFTPITAHCTADVCMPKKFIIGGATMQQESTEGKQAAYQQWWELFWQTYSSNSDLDRQTIIKQMTQLESVWGNLYY